MIGSDCWFLLALYVIALITSFNDAKRGIPALTGTLVIKLVPKLKKNPLKSDLNCIPWDLRLWWLECWTSSCDDDCKFNWWWVGLRIMYINQLFGDWTTGTEIVYECICATKKNATLCTNATYSVRTQIHSYLSSRWLCHHRVLLASTTQLLASIKYTRTLPTPTQPD